MRGTPALVALLLIGPRMLAQPAQPQSLEHEVKAAYLLNFLSYAEWPPDALPAPDEPLRVCVAARDPFAGALQRVVEGVRITGRPIIVEILWQPQAAAGCSLLFLPTGVPVDSWLDRAGPHALTVGESNTFLDRGGVIAFAIDAGRVRFDVNIEAAAARKIRLSSRLLRAARTTHRGRS